MDFGLTEEQQMIVDTTRSFVENELYPHEAEVERTGHLRMDLIREIQQKAIGGGSVRGQHARRRRRRRARYPVVAAL